MLACGLGAVIVKTTLSPCRSQAQSGRLHCAGQLHYPHGAAQPDFRVPVGVARSVDFPGRHAQRIPGGSELAIRTGFRRASALQMNVSSEQGSRHHVQARLCRQTSSTRSHAVVPAGPRLRQYKRGRCCLAVRWRCFSRWGAVLNEVNGVNLNAKAP